MCTNMFAWLLKILCQTFIAFDQNKIIYDQKKKWQEKIRYCTNMVHKSTINNCIYTNVQGSYIYYFSYKPQVQVTSNPETKKKIYMRFH